MLFCGKSAIPGLSYTHAIVTRASKDLREDLQQQYGADLAMPLSSNDGDVCNTDYEDDEGEVLRPSQRSKSAMLSEHSPLIHLKGLSNVQALFNMLHERQPRGGGIQQGPPELLAPFPFVGASISRLDLAVGKVNRSG